MSGEDIEKWEKSLSEEGSLYKTQEYIDALAYFREHYMQVSKNLQIEFFGF